MDIVDYIKAVKKNYDDSPVYDTKKFFLKNMPQDVPVEDDFVPVMPEGRGLPNPETRIQELATGGRIGFAKAGFVFGDQTFNVDISRMTPVQSKSFQKGLKDLEKWSQNPNAENWIETFRTPSKTGQTHQSEFSLNLRKYLQGQPVKARAKELFDSVNIKELLGDTVKDIQTYTPQEFRRVTNLPKGKKGSAVLLKKSMEAANAVRDVFVADPDAYLEDVARGIFGKDFDKASVIGQEDMLSKASDDTAKFLEAVNSNRKVKGFKPISANKLGDIIQNIEDNTKGFKFREGTIREYRFRVRDSLLGIKTESKEGFRNLRNVFGKMDKGKVVDEVFGLSATFKNAPGYTENVQLIDKKINNIKGKQIDKPFAAIVSAVKNKKNIVQYEGKDMNISEAIKKFNAKSKAFSNANNISTPQIFVGNNLDAKKLVSNFNQYSSQAQKKILENAKEGFVLNSTRPSTPAGTFKPTKPVVLGSTFANVDREMLDFRKLPGDVRHFADIAAKYGAKSPALLNALKKAKAAGKWTGAALATEPLFAAPFAEYGHRMGESPERLWGDATLGLVGETAEEEIKKATGERGYATQELDTRGSQLEGITSAYNALNDENDPRGEQRQMFENLYKSTRNKYNKAYDMFVDDTGQFNKDLYNQALNNYTAGVTQIDKFKKLKQAERAEAAGGLEGVLQDREIRDIRGYAEGGITSLNVKKK